jgi:hypothetical protein
MFNKYILKRVHNGVMKMKFGIFQTSGYRGFMINHICTLRLANNGLTYFTFKFISPILTMDFCFEIKATCIAKEISFLPVVLYKI